MNRDVIVIGLSAGGLHPLERVVGGFARDFDAAVFVVQHVGATSHLAAILARISRLPVREAESGMQVERGRILIAPPGVHLLIHDGHTLLRRGPRENMARPAIDPLFRSAACSYTSRVVGVVMSGALNDGTAGLKAIKRCGGTAVVQDPDDAEYPAMPLSALRHVEVDHQADARTMAGLLTRLASTRAGPAPEVPLDIRVETALAAQELQEMATDDALGTRSPFTCPECNGALWEIQDGDLVRYRCHTGHAFTGEVLASAQHQSFETMLWGLLRANKERAALARVLARRQGGIDDILTRQLEQRAADYEEGAEIFRQLLLDREAAAAERQAEEGVGRAGDAQEGN